MSRPPSPIRSVACTTCGAKPNEHCLLLDDNGKALDPKQIARSYHFERITAFEATGRKVKPKSAKRVKAAGKPTGKPASKKVTTKKIVLPKFTKTEIGSRVVLSVVLPQNGSTAELLRSLFNTNAA